MSAPIGCPFCQNKYPANELVSHCRQCPAKKQAGQKAAQPKQEEQKPKQTVVFKEQNFSQQEIQQEIQAPVFQQKPQQQQYQQASLSQDELQNELQQDGSQTDYGNEQTTEEIDRVQCDICGRNFNADRIDKHRATHKQNRKVNIFNADEKRADAFGDAKSLINIQKADESKIQKNLEKLQQNIPKTPLSNAKPLDPTNINVDAVLHPAKPNFNPTNDDGQKPAPKVEEPKKDKKKSKQPEQEAEIPEFRPPAQGPVDEVEKVHIGGERLTRSPKLDQSAVEVRQKKQEQSSDEEPQVEQKLSKSKRRDSSRNESKHKHKHRSSGSKEKENTQMLQMMQQFMQTHQIQPPMNSTRSGLYPSQSYGGYNQPPPAQFAQSQSYRFCVYCGTPFIEGGRFCGVCGAKKIE